MKVIAVNKKAYHDYEILYKIEVGIALTGNEVKSLRAGQVSLKGAYAVLHEGELYLINCNITQYAKSFQKDEEQATRRRKLLLHKKELNRLIGEVARKGVTIIPLKLYFKKHLVKVELGIAKHKKAPSKKKELKERDIRRQAEREIKGGY